MKISREVKIGFFFILGIAVFIWGYNFLKGKGLLSDERTLYAEYVNVNGLEKANPVYINGLKVGRVTGIGFDPDLSGNILVEMTITSDFPVPEDTYARLFSSDLMGSKAIDLMLGYSSTLAESGDTLLSEVEPGLREEVNRQLMPIKRKAENLIASIDTVVVSVQEVFDSQVRDELLTSVTAIRKTFQNLASATGDIDTLLSSESNRISSILYNLDMITANISNNEDQLNEIIANMSMVTDSLANSNIPETFNRLNLVVHDVESILAHIRSGEGTLGNLVYNDSLYNELVRASTELNELLIDIKKNPKRYVRFSVF